MGQVLGFDTGISIPSFTASFGGGILTTILILILVSMSIGILIWIYLDKKTYNRKIVVFENIAGQGYQVVYKDKARLVNIGDGGEELLWLKKKKVYRTAYGRKMGKNEYWFAIGQDGYWYNFLLGDLDAKMGMLDIEPIDRDMRYMHVAIRKNITERYRKIGIMEKYGTIIFSGLFIIIMTFALWLLIDQIGELINQASGVVEGAKKVMDPTLKALSYADSVCSGGSGISSA